MKLFSACQQLKCKTHTNFRLRPLKDKIVLSKTSLLKGIQCSKHLYFYKNHYQKRDAVSKTREALFNRGHRVGELAKMLHPNGIEVTMSSAWAYEEALQQTQQYIREGRSVIYEASFAYKGLFVMVDILYRTKEGWAMAEVKSGLNYSPFYAKDAAIQYMVVSQNLPNLERVEVILLNRDYRLKYPIVAKDIFIAININDDVKKQVPYLAKKQRELIEMLQVGVLPSARTGKHCISPWPCDFLSLCWGESNPLESAPFQLGGISMEEKFSLYQAGNKTASEILENLPPTLNDLRPTLEVESSGIPAIDFKALEKWMKGVGYPLAFIDIECLQPALPLVEGMAPFESLPFLLASHTIENTSATPVAKIASALDGAHALPAFAKALKEIITSVDTIVVFDKTSEARLFRKVFQYLNAGERAEVAGFEERMVDLLEPFQRAWVRLPKTYGQLNLKKILPAIAPDATFENLRISDGLQASEAGEWLFANTNSPNKEEVELELRAYATRDTYALYRIWKALQEYLA